MDNSSKNWAIVFLILGIITIISGILLAFENNILGGVCGSIVGIWLTMDNVKRLRQNDPKT